MSLITGKASFIKFGVIGELPGSPLEFIRSQVAAFSFKDIDEGYDEYSVGWVSILDMLDPAFLTCDMVVGAYVAMSLRVDERKVPAAVLKKFIRKEEERVKKERQLPKLGRSLKVEIKERVRTELIRKAKPAPSVFELFWNLDQGAVLFFTSNKKAQALFEDFFRTSFGVQLVQKVPFTIGLDLLAESDCALLEAATVTAFA